MSAIRIFIDLVNIIIWKILIRKTIHEVFLVDSED
jgi:hypothetical protein